MKGSGLPPYELEPVVQSEMHGDLRPAPRADVIDDHREAFPC